MIYNFKTCCDHKNEADNYFQINTESLLLNGITYAITLGPLKVCATVITYNIPVTGYVTYNDKGTGIYYNPNGCLNCVKLEGFECIKPTPTPLPNLNQLTNECNVITIIPMSVECITKNPSTNTSTDGAVGISITGGTPPYKIVWNYNNITFTAATMVNLSGGYYSATTTDAYGDFVIDSVCTLIAPTATPTPTMTQTPTPTPTPQAYCYTVEITGSACLTCWRTIEGYEECRDLPDQDTTFYVCAQKDTVVSTCTGTGNAIITGGINLCQTYLECEPIPPTPSQTMTQTPTMTHTPTMTQTPTPTIINYEEFIMNAVGVNQIHGPSTAPGFLITSSLGFQINWGDGVVTQYPAGSGIGASHSYSSPYTGPIILLSSNLTSITNFAAQSTPHPNQSLWVSTNELNKLDGLIYFSSSNAEAMFVTGDVINLPNSLTSFNSQNNNLSGNTSNLPPLLTNCSISGVNTISGNTSGLPTGLTYLVLTGNNTISGNTSGLSGITNTCIVYGNNTISGDTSNLPKSISQVEIVGNNTISGNTSGLPNPTYSLVIKGNNTISGDTSGFQTPTQTISIWGNNTISGNVSNLPTSVIQLDILGKNTIGGDISGLPPNLTYFRLQGGFSTVFGNISTLPIGLIQIYLVTLGTLTGDLYYLPTTMKIIEITSPMNFTYTSGRSWSNGFIELYLAPTTNSWSGFNQSQTDNLLIDTQPKYVFVTGLSRFVIKCSGTPKRTSLSNTAFTSLQTLLGTTNVILN